MSVDPGPRIGWSDLDGSWVAERPSPVRPGPGWEDAATAIDRAEREVDLLWYSAIGGDASAELQRLADVSHALGRAARLLRRSDVED